MPSDTCEFHGDGIIFELISGVVFAETNSGPFVGLGQNVCNFFGDAVFLSDVQNWHLGQTIIN